MTESIDKPPLESTVVIVGVGLIGGSLAAAIRQRKLAQTVIGVGRDRVRIEAARTAGIIDEAATDIAAVADRASLIVFGTPVDRLVSDVRTAQAALANSTGNPDILLTDVGSVKASICQGLADFTSFIGSHPIAGSHQQGFEFADPNLFQGRMCVITPLRSASASQVERLERFWRGVGMTTVRMSPEDHDETLALTSHLPHVVASALASILPEDGRSFTGTGFRDTTRIAAGDPRLWTGILRNNTESMLRGIERFQQSLNQFRDAIAAKDVELLERLLREGQASRKALDHSPQRME